MYAICGDISIFSYLHCYPLLGNRVVISTLRKIIKMIILFVRISNCYWIGHKDKKLLLKDF